MVLAPLPFWKETQVYLLGWTGQKDYADEAMEIVLSIRHNSSVFFQPFGILIKLCSREFSLQFLHLMPGSYLVKLWPGSRDTAKYCD